MGISITQLLLVLVVVLILFGAGKLPQVMGELGKGVKNFRDSMKGEQDKKEQSKSAKTAITHKASPAKKNKKA